MLAPWHVLLILLFLVPAVVGLLVGIRKGRVFLGLILGLVLGWIGVLILACVGPTQEELVRRERERMLVRQQAEAQLRSRQ